MHSRDGTELAVTEWPGRNGNSVSVVFLHGMCLDRRTWDGHASRASSDTGAQVITYDHRGHGRSEDADPGTYRVDALSEDLDTVIDDTIPTGRPIVLVGHSMGGMVALDHVTGGHRRSGDIKGLVLCATSAGGLYEFGAGKLLSTPLAAAVAGICRRAPAQVVQATATAISALARWKDPYIADHHPLAATILNAVTAASPRTVAGFLTGLAVYDCRERLDSLSIPVKLLSGGSDCLTPPDHAWILEEKLPASLHLHFPTAGHMLPQTRSEDVAAAVEVAVSDVVADMVMIAGRARVFVSPGEFSSASMSQEGPVSVRRGAGPGTAPRTLFVAPDSL